MAPSHLKLNSAAFDACNRAIIISGCGRSGTTILGQVLHSMQNVEMCFEGATLISLFSMIDEMPREQWMLLYETCLYEEVLIGSLAGRALNCNREDDSSIYRVKDEAWIQSRLQRSQRKADLVKEAAQHIVAYKVPEIVPFLGRAAAYYPGSRIVLLCRNAGDTLNSILRKRWFSDEALRSGVITWPNRTVGELHVPYWLPESETENWLRADELHRAAQYYLLMMEAYRDLPEAIVVNYDHLLESPARTVHELASRLNLSFGSKTEEIVSSIQKTVIPRTELLAQLNPETRTRLEALDGY